MTKYLLFAIFLAVSGCKTKSDKNDPLPDVSGKYEGIIKFSDLIGVPNPTSSKNYSDSLEVTVFKEDNNYVIKGFDTLNIAVPISEQKAYALPKDLNAARINSATIYFEGDSLRIEGNWRYTYTEGNYTSTSIYQRGYSFTGHKER